MTVGSMSGVFTDLVGVDVVPGVLFRAPGGTHRAQQPPDHRGRPVPHAGADDLPVLGVVTQERQLGHHDPEQGRDGELGSGVTDRENPTHTAVNAASSSEICTASYR